MDIEQVRLYCLSLKKVSEDMPFGEDCVTFRLMGKIFCCINLVNNEQLVLKCAPEYSEELRASYPSIEPAWHWNKKHWIQIDLNGYDINDDFIVKLIDHAYDIIKKKLTRAEREAYENNP